MQVLTQKQINELLESVGGAKTDRKPFDCPEVDKIMEGAMLDFSKKKYRVKTKRATQRIYDETDYNRRMSEQMAQEEIENML